MAKLPSIDAAGERFLASDFNQCFQQLRHYDGQVIDTIKFTFATCTGVAAGAMGMVQLSKKENIDLLPVAALLLTACFIFGLFTFLLIVRNRVYFVIVARYINEHRRFFLRTKPLGFPNETGMFTSINQPRFFHWRSIQSIHLYLSAGLNAGLLFGAIALYATLNLAGIAAAVAFVVQIVLAGYYFSRHEGRTAEIAVFGSEEHHRISVK